MSKEPRKNPKAQTELTDEELDGVAGGVKPDLGEPAGYGDQSQGQSLESDFHGPNLFPYPVIPKKTLIG